MYRILIVEDDAAISASIKKQLERWGYEAVCVTDFAKVLECFVQNSPHLVLMDVKLPFYNGYYWCGRLRELSTAPVIFISSAADNMNMIMAMNMGGDDFIAKPFDMDVLMSKLNAMLRRVYEFAPQSALLAYRGAVLNPEEATLCYKSQKLELSKNELKILTLLMENKERVVTRDNLMIKLWESDSYVDENTLSVNINRLRKKLAGIGLADFIVTKKGIGYRLG